jgi:Uma2 family endonuclease
MSTQSKAYLTPEQYLEIERKAEWKSEYYRGEMTSMPHPRFAHVQVVSALVGELSDQVRNTDHEVLFSQMRVYAPRADFITYPDLLVVPRHPQFLDRELDTVLNPTVIVEVLSESTDAYDRGRKFELYRALDTLEEYVMISSHRVRVERYTRLPDGAWNYGEKTDLSDTVELKSLDCSLRLADIYERVDFTKA